MRRHLIAGEEVDLEEGVPSERSLLAQQPRAVLALRPLLLRGDQRFHLRHGGWRGAEATAARAARLGRSHQEILRALNENVEGARADDGRAGQQASRCEVDHLDKQIEAHGLGLRVEQLCAGWRQPWA